MSAFELITPVATFRASLDVITSFYQDDLYNFGYEMEHRIKRIRGKQTVLYESRDISWIAHRVEYIHLHGAVNVSESSVHVSGQRKEDPSFCGTMSRAARRSLKSQIGDLLLAHAVEHLPALQQYYLNQLFAKAREQLLQAQETLQRSLRYLEEREALGCSN